MCWLCRLVITPTPAVSCQQLSEPEWWVTPAESAGSSHHSNQFLGSEAATTSHTEHILTLLGRGEDIIIQRECVNSVQQCEINIHCTCTLHWNPDCLSQRFVLVTTNFSPEIVCQQVVRIRVGFWGKYLPPPPPAYSSLQYSETSPTIVCLCIPRIADDDGGRLFLFQDLPIHFSVLSSLCEMCSLIKTAIVQPSLSISKNLSHSRIKIHFGINIEWTTGFAKWLLCIADSNHSSLKCHSNIMDLLGVNFVNNYRQPITENFIEITTPAPHYKYTPPLHPLYFTYTPPRRWMVAFSRLENIEWFPVFYFLEIYF